MDKPIPPIAPAFTSYSFLSIYKRKKKYLHTSVISKQATKNTPFSTKYHQNIHYMLHLVVLQITIGVPTR